MRQRLTEREQRILAEIERSLSRDGRLDRAMRTMTLPPVPLPDVGRGRPRWMRITWWVAGLWLCLLLVGAARHAVVLVALGVALGIAPALGLGVMEVREAVRRRRSS